MIRSLVLTAALFASGCGEPANSGRRPAETPLRVATASDLQAALPEIAERFRRIHDIEVVPVFGSSGQLAQQIRQGAPYDVFLSANREYVEDLAAKGFIKSDSVRPYAQGLLVLVVNKKSAVDVRKLPDIAKSEARKVSIANPTFAPYGIAARQVIERSGLEGQVTPKLVQADSVRHALQYVQTGNAEVGFVALSVARVPEVTVIDIDPKLYEPINQYMGVVSQSHHGKAAQEFTHFLLSDEGQRMLVSFGFVPIEKQGAK